MATRFFFTVQVNSLKRRTALKAFIEKIFRKHKRLPGNVNYIFCSDEELLEINRQHLRHDYYTDIITFDLSEQQDVLDADIYISVERVRENAKKLGINLNKELHRVIFHGALHLVGYKDKRPGDVKAMRAAEEELLNRYFK